MLTFDVFFKKTLVLFFVCLTEKVKCSVTIPQACHSDEFKQSLTRDSSHEVLNTDMLKDGSLC